MSVSNLYSIIVLFGFLSMAGFESSAQEIEWEISYGDYSDDVMIGFVTAADGGLLSAGHALYPDMEGNINYDLWLMKTTITGEEVWQYYFGGDGDDMAKSIQPTADGGCIVTGLSNSTNGDVESNNGSLDYWVVKFSGAGNIEWAHSFGGESADKAFDGIQTSDGGYFITGTTYSTGGDITFNNGDADTWVIKLSASGVLEWEKSLGGSNFDDLSSVVLSNDGGYILAGTTSSEDGDITENMGLSDLWVVKLSASGEIVWEETYGGSNDDLSLSIRVIPEGGYILAGSTASNDGDVSFNHSGDLGQYDAWVLEISEEGEIIWEKTYGGGSSEVGMDIQHTSDGGYVMVARLSSTDGDVQNPLNTLFGFEEYWLVKLTATGDIEWERAVGGGNIDIPYSVKETVDGGFIIGGESSSDDGDISSPNGKPDYWLVKLSPVILGTIDAASPGRLDVYPNPAKSVLNIATDASMIGAEYRIFNTMGQLLKSGRINAENSLVSIASFTTGFYTFQLQNEKRISSVSFAKE